MAQTKPHANAGRDMNAKSSSRGLSCLAIYRASPIERIQMIKRGIPASQAKDLIAHLAMSQAMALDALKLSQATVNRKAIQDRTLSRDESERVIGMARLIGQLEAMIEESGDPEGFDAAGWISRWLREPLPAFGGARPVEFMDTMEGQAMVSQTLSRMQSGAYA